MGFKKGARATVWWVQPQNDTMTKVLLSTDSKTKEGEYKRDFSEFVMFVGTAAAKKASSLKKLDHIVLGDCEVRYTFDEDNKVKYRNFYVYSYEMAENKGATSGERSAQSAQPAANNYVEANPVEESRLPF